jgi:glycosyltransferase involved in cell wall biosynthesis
LNNIPNKAKPIKILFVLKNFSRSGGVEKITLNLAHQLKEQGYDVGIFIMNGVSVSTEKFNGFSTFIGDNGGVKGILKYTMHLACFIKNGQYSLVVSAKEQANLLTFLASIFNKNFTPIYTRHCAFDVSDQELSVKNITRLYSLYSKGRGKIVAVSTDLANYIKQKLPKAANKVYCCPNPVVNYTLFEKSVNNSDNFKHNKPYMCAVGRLCEQKGYDLLLTSYKIAMDENSDIPDLLIVGEGSDLDELTLQRKNLNLEEKVHFTGFTTNPYYIMTNSELFLLSSRHEGLPTVLIEALALQKNIVAFDCPTGPKEILQNGKYGTLVPVDDVHEFAKSINELLKNPIEIPESAIEQYTYEKSSNAYLALLNK